MWIDIPLGVQLLVMGSGDWWEGIRLLLPFLPVFSLLYFSLSLSSLSLHKNCDKTCIIYFFSSSPSSLLPFSLSLFCFCDSLLPFSYPHPPTHMLDLPLGVGESIPRMSSVAFGAVRTHPEIPCTVKQKKKVHMPFNLLLLELLKFQSVNQTQSRLTFIVSSFKLFTINY